MGGGRSDAPRVGRGGVVYNNGGWDGVCRLSLHGGMRVVSVLADRGAVVELVRSLLDAFRIVLRASMCLLVVAPGAANGASI